MTEPLSAIPSLLAVLRSLPLTILIGLALAGWTILFILFVPSLGRVDLESFRQQCGLWILVATIIFTAFSVTAGIRAYWSHKKAVAARPLLRFVPLHCWWHLAKQQDGSYASQIRIDVQASNISDCPIQILNVRLIGRRAQLVHSDVLLIHADVPPHGSVVTTVDMMVRGMRRRRQPLCGQRRHRRTPVGPEAGRPARRRRHHLCGERGAESRSRDRAGQSPLAHSGQDREDHDPRPRGRRLGPVMSILKGAQPHDRCQADTASAEPNLIPAAAGRWGLGRVQLQKLTPPKPYINGVLWF
jgi:hypothetical protein